MMRTPKIVATSNDDDLTINISKFEPIPITSFSGMNQTCPDEDVDLEALLSVEALEEVSSTKQSNSLHLSSIVDDIDGTTMLGPSYTAFKTLYASSFVENLVENKDILFGRGHGSSKHVGNRIFRSFIRKFKDEYKECTNRNKKIYVLNAYNAWKQIGGRFLEKDGEVWVEADKRKVLTKVGMTFRQKEKAAKPAVDEEVVLMKDDKLVTIVNEAVEMFTNLLVA